VSSQGHSAPDGGEAPQLSAEDRIRIAKAARQVAGYTNFLRWAANFRKNELLPHPRHDRVMLLSPMQSGRFSFCVDGDTLLVGVQTFESAWMATLPFCKAYVSDRLYLSVEGVRCMESQLSPLCVGIFVDSRAKRSVMAHATWLQLVEVVAVGSTIASVGEKLGAPIPIADEDVIAALERFGHAHANRQDLSGFL
jgi:hypothetical protein